MNAAPASTDAPTDAHSDRHLLCPACGYDLRGTAGDRCSECGLAVDRSALGRSNIPWAYRRTVGHVRAFFRTAWQITADAKALRYEAAKLQWAHDAAVFRRWVGALLGACVGVALVLVYRGHGVEEMVVQQEAPFGPGGGLPGHLQDALVPWSAGVALPGALFAYGALVTAYVVAAPGAVVRTTGLPPDRADAARAMGRYAVAPLIWLVPAFALFVVPYVVIVRDAKGLGNAKVVAVPILLSYLLVFLAVALTVWRTGQWRARAAHRGYAMGFLAMGELLLRWAVGIGVLVFVVPWCVGLIWILFDQFRG